MKIHSIGEYQVVKLPKCTEITDLFQLRLAIWKASREFKKLTGNHPTHIGFPSDSGSDKFGFIVEFVQRYQARLLSSFHIPYSEIWIGTYLYGNSMTKAMEWTKKPSHIYEEVRHVGRGRKRSKAIKVTIPVNHPLKNVTKGDRSWWDSR